MENNENTSTYEKISDICDSHDESIGDHLLYNNGIFFYFSKKDKKQNKLFEAVEKFLKKNDIQYDTHQFKNLLVITSIGDDGRLDSNEIKGPGIVIAIDHEVTLEEETLYTLSLDPVKTI